MPDRQIPDIKARFVTDLTGLTKAQTKAKAVKDDLDGLGKGGDPITARLKPAGQTLDQIGTKLSVGVTLPLVALGAKAISSSRSFDSAFARMRSLAGVTADEVEGLKDSILGLSGETGRAPQELADALYFARSAGLDAATSMEIVEQAAKAAAIGLGSTETIVDAVTSAIGAYGPQVLSAADATDILTGAARVAKIEASELAPQLGRLLPTASALGVGFDEVAAAVSFLSQKSGNASLSSTQLDGVLRKLLLPTQQGKQALEELGLSAASLRDIIAKDGLEGALALLRDELEGNDELLGRVFDDARAANGAMLLLGDATGGLATAFDEVSESAGSTNDAFDDFAASDLFKNDQDLARVQAQLIELGQILVPLATDVLGFVTDVGAAFGALPEPIQNALVVSALFAASAGPLIKAGRGISESVGLARDAFASFKAKGLAGLAGPGGALLGVAAAATLAAIAFKAWQDRQAEVAKIASNVRAEIDDLTQSFAEAGAAAARSTFNENKQVDDLERLGVGYDLVSAAIGGSADAARIFRQRLVETGEIEFVPTGVEKDLDVLAQRYIETGDATGVLITGNAGLVRSFDDLTEQTRKATEVKIADAVALGALTAEQGDALLATDDYAAAVDAANAALLRHERQQARLAPITKTANEGVVEFVGYLDDEAIAAAAAAEETEDLTAVVADVTDEFDRGAAIVDAFADALDTLLGVNLDVESTLLNAREATIKLTEAIAENGGTIDINTEAGRANREQILATTRDQISYAEALVRQNGDIQGATDSLNFYIASLRQQLLASGLSEDAIDSYLDSLGLTPEKVETLISQVGAQVAAEEVAEMRAAIVDLPAETVTELTAALDAGDIEAARLAFAELTKTETKTINVRTSGGGGNVTFRAEGGRVSAGDAVGFNEKGRELFFPDTDGFVVSSNVVNRLERLLAAGAATSAPAATTTAANGSSDALAAAPLHFHNYDRPVGPADIAEAYAIAEMSGSGAR